MKQAQIQVTFHWIYLLIAGAVILLFFFSLILSQKQRSEEYLRQDLVQVMSSLFTAASLSEKTKTTVDTNLGQYALTFSCREGVSAFTLEGSSSFVEDSVHPLFGPATLQAAQLSLWSLPYKLPFKVTDFLLVTSPNVQYVVVGSSPFAEEFLKEASVDPAVRFRLTTQQIFPEQLPLFDPGKNRQVRLLDVSGTALQEKVIVPEKLRHLDDGAVTGVAFLSGETQAEYYQKEGERWKKTGTADLISLGGERDAVKYAALFAQDAEAYNCNLQKAFRRLQYLNEIYGGREITANLAGGKLQGMINFYASFPDSTLQQNCAPYLDQIQQALQSHQNTVRACLTSPSSCLGLVSSAQQIKLANQQLALNNCILLY